MTETTEADTETTEGETWPDGAPPSAPPLPGTLTLPLTDIHPYWRNPRRIPEAAVAAVAESIERFGYTQPIVVDRDHVVVVGHTRLRALAALGWTAAPVYVTTLPDDKVREYRLVDNRTAEMTAWDHAALVSELRELEAGLLASFFPDVDLEIGSVTDAVTTAREVEKAADEVKEVPGADPTATHTTDVECPSCAATFQVRTRSLPGLSYSDLYELATSAPDEVGGGREARAQA